jgi:hypothetical protein
MSKELMPLSALAKAAGVGYITASKAHFAGVLTASRVGASGQRFYDVSQVEALKRFAAPPPPPPSEPPAVVLDPVVTGLVKLSRRSRGEKAVEPLTQPELAAVQIFTAFRRGRQARVGKLHEIAKATATLRGLGGETTL